MTDSLEEKTEKKEKPFFSHIKLSEYSSDKLDRWIEQVNAKKKVRIARRDILSWWLARSPENLSNSEINALVEEFYDEEAFLRQLLRDVKKAKKEGKTEPSLDLVLKPRKLETKKILGEPDTKEVHLAEETAQLNVSTEF